MILNYFKSFKKGFNLKNIFGKQLIDASTTNYIQSIFDQIADGSLKVDALAKSTSKLDKELISYININKDATLTTEGFTKHVEATGTSLTKLSVKSKLAKVGVAALNATLTMGISLLAGFVVEGVISWMDDVTHKSEKLAEVAEESIAKIRELKDEFKSNKEFVDNNSQRFAELYQGVDEFGDNISLSTSDYEEFLNISNQLANIFPTLDRAYDDNGNAILQLSGNVDTIVGSLNTLIETERELMNIQIADEMPSIFDNAKSASVDYVSEIEKLQNQLEILQSNHDLITSSMISKMYDGQFDMIVDTKEDLQRFYKMLQDLNLDYTIGEVSEVFAGYNADGKQRNQYKQTIEITSDYEAIRKSYIGNLDGLMNEIQATIQKNKSNWSTVINSALSWLNTDSTYQVMADNVKSHIQDMINNLNWEDLDFNSWGEAETYIRQNILNVFSGNYLSTELKNRLLTSLEQGTLSDNEYISIIEKLQSDIQAYLKSHHPEIEFSLDWLIVNKKDADKRFQNRLNELIKNPQDGVSINASVEEYGIDTAAEKEMFLEAASGVDTWAEAFDNYAEMVKQAAEELRELEEISEDLDEIQSAYQIVSGAVDEYNEYKALSLDTVQSLIALDSEYMSLLYDENGQLVLNKEAYQELAKARLYDLYTKLASDAVNMLDSMESEEEAAESLEQSLDGLIETKKTDIQVTLDQAKAKLTADALLGKSVSNREKVLAEIQNQFNLLNTAMNSINFDGFFDGGNSSSATNKFSEEIDWVAESIENASKKIEELNDVLNNTQGFQGRLEIYERLKEANQDLIDTTQKASNKYKEIWEDKASKINPKYIDLITGDRSKFQIENFTDEDVYNSIKEGMDAYDAWQSSIEKYNDALEKQKDIQDDINSLYLEKAEINLEILNLEDQSSMTVSEKNKWLEKEKQIKANILQYNLALAESDEERLKFEKEYANYLEENAEKQYQNLREERASRADYFGTRIQDIQNEIELEEVRGGQGTATQYKQMNTFLDKQIAVYQQDYDEALVKRNAATPRTDEWYQYNQEIQEAQNNIQNCTQAQIENNKAILLLPVKQYEDLVEDLEDTLKTQTKIKEEIEGAINAASGLIQTQINDYENLREASNNSYDNQIKDIQTKKDALTESNNLLENQIALEKAQYELHRAKTQKNVKILRNGEFVYEADQDAIREAQEELDKALYNQKISDFDSQIKSLEDAKEEADNEYEKQIKRLTDYKDKIDSIFESYEQVLGLQKLTEQFGVNIIQRIISGDASAIADMNTAYINISTDVNNTEEKIEKYQQDIEAIKTLAVEWNGSADTIESAKKKIDTIISDNKKEIKAIEKRNANTKSLATEWSNTELSIQETLDLINEDHLLSTETEADILSQRLESIKDFAEKAKSYLDSINSNLAIAKEKQAELNRIEDENKKKTTSSKTTTSSKYSKTVNVGKSHDGMELGYIGDANSKESKDTFKLIALSELKQDEIPRILQVGEAVLTKWQQQNILDNIYTSFNSGLQFGNLLNKKQDMPSISFNGDIVLQGVQNTTELAQKIKMEFSNKLKQELYKN